MLRVLPRSGYRFSHLAGTIFENTNKPLRDWFRVVHLMLTSKKGISALQIQRIMGFGSYKTAWYMCHRIRTALIEAPEIEAWRHCRGRRDLYRRQGQEQALGKHGDRGGGQAGKTPIIGAVKRKGNVVARVL